MAQAVVVVQMSIIAILMFGDKIFPMIGMQPPALYQQVQDMKFPVGEKAFCNTHKFEVAACITFRHCVSQRYDTIDNDQLQQIVVDYCFTKDATMYQLSLARLYLPLCSSSAVALAVTCAVDLWLELVAAYAICCI